MSRWTTLVFWTRRLLPMLALCLLALPPARLTTAGPPRPALVQAPIVLNLQWSAAASYATWSVVWGAIDNDSSLDLVTGNYGQQNLVYLNDGAGNFTTTRPFGTGADKTTSVAVADVNGDGYSDLIAGNDGEQNVVYLNDGTGQFFSGALNCADTAHMRCFGTGVDHTTSVAVADLNGDNHPDLVTGNYLEQNVVYLNDGTGQFFSGAVDCADTAHMRCFGPGNDNTRGVALADVNGDQRLDIVVGNYNQQNVAYLDDGAGNFTTAQPFGTGADLTTSVAAGDLNGDGHPDIVVGNDGQQSAVYLNNGTGTFASGPLSCGVTPGVICFGAADNHTYSVAVGDVDRDGVPDIAAGNGSTSGSGGAVQIYRNQGGSLAISPDWSSTETNNVYSVAWGDIDGDGGADLGVGNYNQPNRVYRNDTGAPPTISPLADQSVPENGVAGPLSFTVDDRNGPADMLTVSADSSNQELVPNANIVLAGGGANRSVTIFPAQTNAIGAPTRQGSAVIMLYVSNAFTTSYISFTLTVTPPPWLALLYLAGDDAAVGQPSQGRTNLGEHGQALIGRLASMPFNPNMRLAVLFDNHNSIGDSHVYVRDPDGLTDVTGILTKTGSLWPNFPTNHELDSGSPATVRSFISWARGTYPGSPHTFFADVSHGGGWAPDFADPAGQSYGLRRDQAGGWRGMNLDATSGGTSLSTNGMKQALTGVGPIDVLFLDASLMGMLECAYELRDSADYLVAGENLLYDSLPYDDYLSAQQLTASTSPSALATAIVDGYNAQLNPVAIAALDLRQLRDGVTDNLAVRLNTLAEQLLAGLPPPPVPVNLPLRIAILNLYSQSQKLDYDTSRTIDATDGYVDLADLARRLRDSTDPAFTPDMKSAAAAVLEAVAGGGAIAPVVAHNRSASGVYLGNTVSLGGANGLSIYMPLGEQDNRSTRVDPNNPGQPAQPEQQIGYYGNPSQLALTQDAPKWADLLVRLQSDLPTRPAERPFHSAALIGVNRLFYLPIVGR
jgi:hypothetical protein